MIALASIAFFSGATVNDLWFDLGAWVKDFQTLLTGMVAVATVFAAFHQIEENRKDRQADRRFTLRPRLEAIEAIEGFAIRTRGYYYAPARSKAQGRKAPILSDAILHSSQVAGPDVAKAVSELKDVMDGVLRSVENPYFSNAVWGEPATYRYVDDANAVLACNVTLLACKSQRDRLELMVSGHGGA